MGKLFLIEYNVTSFCYSRKKSPTRIFEIFSIHKVKLANSWTIEIHFYKHEHHLSRDHFSKENNSRSHGNRKFNKWFSVKLLFEIVPDTNPRKPKQFCYSTKISGKQRTESREEIELPCRGEFSLNNVENLEKWKIFLSKILRREIEHHCEACEQWKMNKFFVAELKIVQSKV